MVVRRPIVIKRFYDGLLLLITYDPLQGKLERQRAPEHAKAIHEQGWLNDRGRPNGTEPTARKGFSLLTPAVRGFSPWPRHVRLGRSRQRVRWLPLLGLTVVVK